MLENEEIGLDYATVALEDMYCQLLQAGGAIPIDKEAWGNHVTDHDYWALLGIPSETVSYDGDTNISARLAVVPIERVDKPASAGRKAENQFYGRLQDDSMDVVKDVDGMSGGPIFALRKTEDIWRYSVIGVQTGWYPSSRIITACPFISLGMALEPVVADVRAAQASSAT